MSPAHHVLIDDIRDTAREAARSRDRRMGLGDLLSALTAHITIDSDTTTMRSEFEARLGRLIGVSAVRLREASPEYGRSPDRAGPPHALALEVPARRGSRAYRLEARFGPDRQPDAWGIQTLEFAAHLAAFMIDRDRPPGVLAPGGRTSAGPGGGDPSPLVGTSRQMIDLRERIRRVAATDFTVLIEGESGSGKELVARQIHELSRRRGGPFVAVNCAAIVDSLLEAELFGIEERTATGVRGRRGKIEHADGGTLFLDEVADLAPPAQAKLLRVIQGLFVERVGGHATRRVDARIVAATNRSLRQLVAQGLFREDLYYRLAGVELHVPPLRSRREDIADLGAHFLARHRPTRTLRLSAAALAALDAHDWPGNVRELERTLEGAVTTARSEVIEVDDLAFAIRRPFLEVVAPSLERDDTMRAWGARYAQVVLERCGRNKRQACRILGISYHTLQAYLTVWRDAGTAARHGVTAAPGAAPLSDRRSVQAGVRHGEAAEARGL